VITTQHIAIVGGTAGIGLAVAQMAADAGAEARLGGSSRDRLDQALRQFNGKVKGELVDVRDEDSIRRFFVHAGAIDHVVSTIGLNYRPVRVRDGRRADLDDLFTVKYWGQFLVAKHAAEQLAANGSITLTSGVLSHRPAEGFAALASVNAGVEALARTLALELAPRRVNVVCPGFVDTGKLHTDQAQKSIHAARLFYAFWNTGDPQLARIVLAPSFIDRTLPKGRPQGVDGPLFASGNFRHAVPDLRCDIEQLIVTGDRVVAHLHFSGHFTGTFGEKQGAGQPIDFIATDILRLEDGRITDNWHIEDNLTLMQQLEIVPP
jgi:NAD(P)-dependent dehydrogenase (short-subunit alcohol dehydrogenase family)